MARPRRVLLIATTTGYQTRQFDDAAARARRRDRLRHRSLRSPRRPVARRRDSGAVPRRGGVRRHRCRGAVGAAGRRGARRGRPARRCWRRRCSAGSGCRAILLGGRDRQGQAPAREPNCATPACRFPRSRIVRASDDETAVASRLSFPVVVKPTTLSARRGVIRADDAASFVAAVARIRRLLESPDVRTAARRQRSDCCRSSATSMARKYARRRR